MMQDKVTIISGRYRPIQELHRGQWSSTYLAEDLGMPDRSKCIVKQVRLDETAELGQIKAHWLRQVLIWQTKVVDRQNPSITQLLACFVENSCLYLVQKYIEGITIASLIETKSQLTAAQVVSWLQEMLSILTVIHQQGIVHGNLKPANFVIASKSSRVTLVDFGIAHNIVKRLSNSDDSVNHNPEIPANSYYPQPESFILDPQKGFAADIYAVGAIAIQALTDVESIDAVLNTDINRFLTENRPDLNPQLIAILNKMIVLNSDNSYTSAAEIIKDLEGLSKTGKMTTKLDSSPVTSEVEATKFPTKLKTRLYSIGLQPKQWLAIVAGIAVIAGIGEILVPTIRPAYYVWQGKRQSEPQTALESFQKAVKINPKFTPAWNNRGNALLTLERYRAAIFTYDKALELSPKNASLWKGRGDALYRLERYEAAITAYDKALELSPKNPAILNRKGRALYKLERYVDALAIQEQALKIQPDFVNAMKDRGVALLGMGKYEEAMVAFSNAQTFAPLNPELWQNRALALQYMNRPQEAMGLYQEAVEAYDKIIEENPNDITAILDQANVLNKLRQPQQALLAYERALEVNPDSHLAWLGKGNTFFALGKYEDALSAFNRAVKLQPKSYLTWHNRGSLLRDGLKNLSEAIASYDRSLEINPNFYHAWRDRGVALSQNQQHTEAIKSYKKALDLRPVDHKSWLGRGIALASLGRNEEAIYSFNRAKELQPQDPLVLMNYGMALENNQKYTEACANYQQLLEINPAFTPAIQRSKSLNCQ